MAEHGTRPSLLAAILLLGAPLVALTTPALLRSPGDDLTVIDGVWALDYERAFDAGLSIRSAAVSTWAVIQYGLFGEGRPGVLVGADGWLYTTEEFAVLPDADAEIGAKLATILEIANDLEERGVKLVVALIPDKARIEGEHLGRYIRPPELATRYATVRQAIIDRGVPAPDLLAAMMEGKGHASMFLRTDTHWAPEGADVAAAALAEAIAPLLSAEARSVVSTNPGETVMHSGDLLNFLPLGVFAAMGPPPDTIETQTTTVESAEASGLFDTVAIPVALVGTSYSANSLWNFAGALSQRLQADVLNVSAEGQGPMRPMFDYLDSSTLAETSPEVLVWEIPERFLQVHYDAPSSNPTSSP